MKLGRRYVADVVNMNPFEEIKGYEGDLLIVHGTADKIVANHYAEEVESVYRVRGQGLVQLQFIDGGNHMFSKKHDKIAIEYLERFVRNVDRYNPICWDIIEPEMTKTIVIPQKCLLFIQTVQDQVSFCFYNFLELFGISF